MGNCLVTKLDAVVNNDALPEIGYVTVAKFNGTNVDLTSDNLNLGINSGNIKIHGNAYFTKNGVDIGKTNSVWGTPYQTDNGLHIVDGDVYLLCQKNTLRIDLTLNGSYVKEVDITDIGHLFEVAQERLYISADNIVGNIETSQIGKYKIVEIQTTDNSAFGNIEALTEFNNKITRFHLSGFKYIEGSINKFLDNLAKVRVDGDVNVIFYGATRLYFNGSAVQDFNHVVRISNHTWTIV